MISDTMKITILCENNMWYRWSKWCLAEWWLSVHIQTEQWSVLFDTWWTDVYVHNAKQLGIDLQSVDVVAFSHRHRDHVSGILNHPFDSKKPLVCHPDVLENVPEKIREVLEKDFDLVFPTWSYEIFDDFFFLGEIPRKAIFEWWPYKGDPLKDDTALAIKTSKGAVVITWCSHAWITNICEYAKEVTWQNLHMVMWWFHMFEKDVEAVEWALAYFRKEKIQHLYPMHCVDFPTLAKFHTEFGIVKLNAGDEVMI